MTRFWKYAHGFFHLSGIPISAAFGQRVHDPSTIVEVEGRFHFFSTGPGVKSWSSTGLIRWKKGLPVFPVIPDWISNVAPKSKEAPWVHKRGHLYYLSYASEWPEKMAYSTAENINSPWTFRGRFKEWAGNSNTNHGAIIDFKGESYFIFHNGGLLGGGSFRRSVCVERLHYNPDGTIQMIHESSEGIDGLVDGSK